MDISSSPFGGFDVFSSKDFITASLTQDAPSGLNDDFMMFDFLSTDALPEETTPTRTINDDSVRASTLDVASTVDYFTRSPSFEAPISLQLHSQQPLPHLSQSQYHNHQSMSHSWEMWSECTPLTNGDAVMAVSVADEGFGHQYAHQFQEQTIKPVGIEAFVSFMVHGALLM